MDKPHCGSQDRTSAPASHADPRNLVPTLSPLLESDAALNKERLDSRRAADGTLQNPPFKTKG